ncbi:NAD(P)/FAD-dependent oxidoreductase [Staphylococcus equorum]|uniref:4,4'-diaponeurosporene oxygenase n=1 Tax=Staphylococcus equorum TaxID=246432 RepID=A0A9X4LA34_9STAP|nr:NAD(P)/FAD-dependent oxidoreductase [Staphylococcus equorum]MDG0842934.1 NAD(P)/FAD-dependent oxidoreductase [Staphylococcus equorum]MDG0859444.1 NAD(P)/FAD-dependent oxidoreductase [Staphylococcus equorum]
MKKSVVVIGGGLGGITAAIRMAQEGYQVELYEKNGHIGGKVNRLETKGFGFDLGPSILTMPEIFKSLFRYSSKKIEDYINIEKLELQIRNFYHNYEIIDLYQSLQDTFENNQNVSQKDIDEMQQFFDYAERIHRFTELGYFNKGLDYIKNLIQFHGPLSALKGFDYFHTMQQAINKRVSNPYLQEMLGYFIKYVGSSSYDAPAVMSLLPQMQHEQGLWYVSGGIHKLAEGLEQLALEEGVEIHLNQSIVAMGTGQQNQITYIELEDQTRIKADYFISNMEVLPLYRKLLSINEKKLEKLEDKFEPASSGYVMHLGVSKQYPQLKHHNFFFSIDSKRNYHEVFHEYKLPTDPTIYVVNSNKTDEKQAPKGYENIKVLPHVPYIQEHPFSKVEYEQFREVILKKLEAMGLTDLRQNIVYEDTWTPHDIEQKYCSNKGAIYGVVSNRKKNHGFKFPKKSPYFSNLYFVGGSVNPGAGMPMVALSGIQVVDQIIDEDGE